MSERALLFTSAGLTLALPARLGRETFVLQRLLPLPGGQSALIGLTEVRGRAVPLLDLPGLLGLLPAEGSRSAPEPGSLALLLDLNGEALAFPVEQVLGVTTLEELPRPTGLLSAPFNSGTATLHALNVGALVATIRLRLPAA